MSDDKPTLRATIRRSRQQEPIELAQQRTRLLRSIAPDLADVCAGGVAAFQPTNHEPDIGPLLGDLGVTVYLPRAAPGAQLDWVVAQSTDLTGTRQGIPVPSGPTVASGGEIAALGIGAILVPALAVDPTTGARLGYGAGYYDRLLPQLPGAVLVIGVCRAVDLVTVRPEPHDVAMMAVLTEAGLHRVGSGEAVTATAPTA